MVVSKEQIMALPNLHAYWKYADTVVPFRIEPIDRPTVAPSFVQRPLVQKEVKERALKLVPPVSNGGSNGSGNEGTKITTRMINDIDTGF